MDNNRKFERSATNKVLGGVCAGLADYFNIDVTLMRVLFFFAALCGSFGFWLYIILWIVTPQEKVLPNYGNPQEETIDITPHDDDKNKTKKVALTTAILLIVIGLMALLDNFLRIDIWKLWPLILIVLGIIIIVNTQKNNKNE